MASTHFNASFTDDYVKLVSGNFSTTLLPSPSITASLSLSFPNSTGPNGSYLIYGTGGGLTWGLTADTRYALPTPRDDYYRTRTNDTLAVSVVSSGAGANTGGTDFSGISPSGVLRPITSMTILKNVTRGVLVSSGLLGQYTYQSFPRFVGRDYFSYSVQDSSGVTSGGHGSCIIDVVASGVQIPNMAGGITGDFFCYIGTSANTIRSFAQASLIN